MAVGPDRNSDARAVCHTGSRSTARPARVSTLHATRAAWRVHARKPANRSRPCSGLEGSRSLGIEQLRGSVDRRQVAHGEPDSTGLLHVLKSPVVDTAACHSQTRSLGDPVARSPVHASSPPDRAPAERRGRRSESLSVTNQRMHRVPTEWNMLQTDICIGSQPGILKQQAGELAHEPRQVREATTEPERLHLGLRPLGGPLLAADAITRRPSPRCVRRRVGSARTPCAADCHAAIAETAPPVQGSDRRGRAREC